MISLFYLRWPGNQGMVTNKEEAVEVNTVVTIGLRFRVYSSVR